MTYPMQSLWATGYLLPVLAREQVKELEEKLCHDLHCSLSLSDPVLSQGAERCIIAWYNSM